jgi:DHA1 family bicyclomycin/chloramphenicol resistance-like MFS transporter
MGFIGGSQLNVFLLRRFSSQRLFLVALVVQVFIGVLFLVGTIGHLVDLNASLVLFFIFLTCIGLTNPNGGALALRPFSRDAGRATALLGFSQAGAGATISMSIGVFGVQAIVLLLSSTALVALAILALGKSKIGELTENEEEDTVLIH